MEVMVVVVVVNSARMLVQRRRDLHPVPEVTAMGRRSSMVARNSTMDIKTVTATTAIMEAMITAMELLSRILGTAEFRHLKTLTVERDGLRQVDVLEVVVVDGHRLAMRNEVAITHPVEEAEVVWVQVRDLGEVAEGQTPTGHPPNMVVGFDINSIHISAD